MTSLRGKLLFSLWSTLAVVGATSAAVAFTVSRQEINGLLDLHMAQIAKFMAAASPATTISPPHVVPQLRAVDLEDSYLLGVHRGDGALIYASRPEIETLSPKWLGFRTVRLAGDDYRVYSAWSGDRRIVVAQQLELRQEAVTAAVLAALVPILILVPALGIVVSYVIRWQLHPLDIAAQAVAERPPFALDALSVTGLPAEIVPLIHEINRLLTRLQAATEQEQRFIADAAHALRTPLAALQLQADVIDSTADPAKRAARLIELRAGIRRATRLANNLLALARQESTAPPVRGAVDLDVAVTETCAMYAPIAKARAVNVRLNADSGAKIARSTRDIVQLVGNLLDNALRHTPDLGTVTVTTRRESDGALIVIADEGPGLPNDELHKVFERFYRAPGDQTEGSGLGLAVVREIAAQAGGHVQLANQIGRKGLVASIWLPIETTHAAESFL